MKLEQATLKAIDTTYHPRELNEGRKPRASAKAAIEKHDFEKHLHSAFEEKQGAARESSPSQKAGPNRVKEVESENLISALTVDEMRFISDLLAIDDLTKHLGYPETPGQETNDSLGQKVDYSA